MEYKIDSRLKSGTIEADRKNRLLNLFFFFGQKTRNSSLKRQKLSKKW